MLPGLTTWYVPLARAGEAPPGWLIVLGWLASQALAAFSCLEFIGRARGSSHFGPGLRLYLAHGLLGLAWCSLFFIQRALGPAVLAGADHHAGQDFFLPGCPAHAARVSLDRFSHRPVPCRISTA